MAGATGENAESPTISSRQQAIRKPPRNRLSCQVTLLDGTVLTTDQLQVSISFFNGFLTPFQPGLGPFFKQCLTCEFSF